MGFNCLEGVQHGISKHERRMLETAFPDNDPVFILESAFMFTKHFCKFSYLILDTTWDWCERFHFHQQIQQCTGKKKKKKMLDMNKRERARPFYITSLPAYLYLQARCANGRGREPRARFFLLTGTAHLTFLLRELSDLRENCVLLPAKVFY